MNFETKTPWRSIALSLVTALALLGSVACSSTRPAGEQIDDATITAKVKTKLAADPDINPFNIDVDTVEGVVRLSGQVEKDFAREEAERLAWDTRGVVSVENDITLGEKTIGESIDDTTIATKIEAKYTADSELNPFNIDVDVEYGVVTLSGRVVSRDHEEHAIRIARAVKGVRDVNSRLRIGDRDGR